MPEAVTAAESTPATPAPAVVEAAPKTALARFLATANAADPDPAPAKQEDPAPVVPVEEPAPEVKPEAPKAKTEDFLALSREHKALRQQQANVANEKAAIVNERAKLKADLDELADHRKFRDSLKTPAAMAELRKHGVTYEALLKQEMAHLEAESSPEAKRIQELEAKIAAKEAAEKEAAAGNVEASRRQAQASVREAIEKEFTTNADKFPIAVHHKAVDQVYAKLKDNFDKTAKFDDKGVCTYVAPLSFTEACSLVEKDFEDAIEQLSQIPKVKQKLGLVPSAPAGAKPETKKPALKKLIEAVEAEPTTLNNSVTASPAQSADAPKTTPEQRLRAAFILSVCR